VRAHAPRVARDPAARFPSRAAPLPGPVHAPPFPGSPAQLVLLAAGRAGRLPGRLPPGKPRKDTRLPLPAPAIDHPPALAAVAPAQRPAREAGLVAGTAANARWFPPPLECGVLQSGLASPRGADRRGTTRAPDPPRPVRLRGGPSFPGLSAAGGGCQRYPPPPGPRPLPPPGTPATPSRLPARGRPAGALGE